MATENHGYVGGVVMGWIEGEVRVSLISKEFQFTHTRCNLVVDQFGASLQFTLALMVTIGRYTLERLEEN
ncbi:unnamed protein product [Lathyrus sativus]|nr:unnamed protein product [Lathyrus sativus]